MKSFMKEDKTDLCLFLLYVCDQIKATQEAAMRGPKS